MFLYSSLINPPAELTIGTLSAAQCHLRASPSIRLFTPTCPLALMRPLSTNWGSTPTLRLLTHRSACCLVISGAVELTQIILFATGMVMSTSPYRAGTPKAIRTQGSQLSADTRGCGRFPARKAISTGAILIPVN